MPPITHPKTGIPPGGTTSAEPVLSPLRHSHRGADDDDDAVNLGAFVKYPGFPILSTDVVLLAS